MTRGECWTTAYVETRRLPSFVRDREVARRFAELVAAAGVAASRPFFDRRPVLGR